jgi:hypothetical protein
VEFRSYAPILYRQSYKVGQQARGWISATGEKAQLHADYLDAEFGGVRSGYVRLANNIPRSRVREILMSTNLMSVPVMASAIFRATDPAPNPPPIDIPPVVPPERQLPGIPGVPDPNPVEIPEPAPA